MNPKALQDKIKDAIERHPDWDDTRIANSCGAHIGEVRAIRAGESIPKPSAPGLTQEIAGLISLEKIIQRYDIKSAIERELSVLPRGKLIEETELCRRAAGTDRYRFRKTVENNSEAFRVFRIKLKLQDGEPQWYWGHEDDISKSLRIRDL